MITNLDKLGKIVIPKNIRKELGITMETDLNIQTDGKRIIIEPIMKDRAIKEKDGIFVFMGVLSHDTMRLYRKIGKNG